MLVPILTNGLDDPNDGKTWTPYFLSTSRKRLHWTIVALVFAATFIRFRAPAIPSQATLVARLLPEELATASGFYGPGAYLSWLLTITSVQLSAFGSSWAIDYPLGLDGELLAGAAYPLTAAAHLIVLRGEYGPDMRNASLIAAAQVVADAPRVFAPIVVMRVQETTVLRRVLCILTLVICTGVGLVYPVRSTAVPAQLALQTACLADAVYNAVQFMLATACNRYTWGTQVASAVVLGSVVLLGGFYVQLVQTVWGEGGLQMPVLATGTSLAELDQAAALALTGICMAVQWSQRLKIWRTEEDEDQGRCQRVHDQDVQLDERDQEKNMLPRITVLSPDGTTADFEEEEKMP